MELWLRYGVIVLAGVEFECVGGDCGVKFCEWLKENEEKFILYKRKQFYKKTNEKLHELQLTHCTCKGEIAKQKYCSGPFEK